MPASKDKGKDKEVAGPIERYLIHRANEAAVAEKPSLWDNLLRDLLPKSTPAAKAAAKMQALVRARKARKQSAAMGKKQAVEAAAEEAKSLEARRVEAAAAVKAHVDGAYPPPLWRTHWPQAWER